MGIEALKLMAVLLRKATFAADSLSLLEMIRRCEQHAKKQQLFTAGPSQKLRNTHFPQQSIIQNIFIVQIQIIYAKTRH